MTQPARQTFEGLFQLWMQLRKVTHTMHSYWKMQFHVKVCPPPKKKKKNGDPSWSCLYTSFGSVHISQYPCSFCLFTALYSSVNITISDKTHLSTSHQCQAGVWCLMCWGILRTGHLELLWTCSILEGYNMNRMSGLISNEEIHLLFFFNTLPWPCKWATVSETNNNKKKKGQSQRRLWCIVSKTLLDLA